MKGNKQYKGWNMGSHKISCESAVKLLLTMIFILTSIGISLKHGVFSYWAYGDSQMLTAGIHFFNEGFVYHHFLPLVNPGTTHDLILNNGPNGRYFHYPALHAIVIGFLLKVVGCFVSISQIDLETLKKIPQFFFLMISLLAIYGFFIYVKKATHSIYALLTALMILLSGWYLKFGYSLCDQPMHYLFCALNLLLVQKIISQQYLHDKRLSLVDIFSLSLICFLAARNSIETPIILCSLNILVFGYFKYLNPRKISLLPILLTVLFSFIAIFIQFYQGYTEYSNLADFLAHWRSTATSRFNLSEVGAADLIAQALSGFNTHLGILGGLSVFVLAKIVWRSKCSNIYEITVAITFFYMVSTIMLFILLPRQMMYMSSYTLFYFYQAVFLAIPISLFSFANKISWSISGKFNLLMFLIMTLILVNYCYCQAKYTFESTLFPSVFDQSQDFWAYKPQSKKFISSVGYKKIEEVRAITKSKDILIVPAELSGNSSFESNAIFEFYIQRHSIPNHDQNDWCQILRSRVKEIQHVILLDNKLNVISRIDC